ncbi:MAG: TIGR00270 family protein [Candidatus Aenigmarchaeota archaeon]|nr:TIGR00270 family protein [Candidatus Aenigmarchaeota archaeon]
MTECKICGSKKANRKAKIEGAILTVCEECVRFGQEVKPPEVKTVKKYVPKIEEPREILKPNFNEIIRNSREKMKLKQEDLAKKINEKSSTIKRIEEGWEPPSKLIRKLEKFFNIKLTEKPEEKTLKTKADKKKLTIGDIIEIR